ncbi:13874_t:CDS:10, partial [Entrophospora sp. SA101]
YVYTTIFLKPLRVENENELFCRMFGLDAYGLFELSSERRELDAFSALKAFTVNITMLDNLNEDTTVLDGLGSRYPRLTITLYHITTLDNLNSDITVLGQVVDDYHDEASGENVFYFWHTIAQEKKELKLMTLENKKMIFQKEKDMLIERTALQHAKLLCTTAQEVGSQSKMVQEEITEIIQPNPFVAGLQGTKHGRDIEEEDDEFNADITIIGGKSTDWIVNGIHIRERLTQYQLDKNPSKTKPEYYDVIFFDSNDKDGFLGTLDKSIIVQMRNDIRKKEEKTKDNMEQEIKLFLDSIIDRDIKKTKEKLNRRKEETISSFEKSFALHFVSQLMEDVNLFLDPMSEGTYIINVLAPILGYFFIKNKKDWLASYGETCLKASAKDGNSQKTDDERRSSGKKIDTIISMREEDKEFSVTEVSGPLMKNDWAHFKGDWMKITKMLKTLMNQFAELSPSSDITLVRLYGLQSYLNELTIYEFQLKYTEIYTMEATLTFSLPKTWTDMAKAHETVMGLLKYECLLSESSKTIRDFLWNKDSRVETIKMTTRMIHTPETVNGAEFSLEKYKDLPTSGFEFLTVYTCMQSDSNLLYIV